MSPTELCEGDKPTCSEASRAAEMHLCTLDLACDSRGERKVVECDDRAVFVAAGGVGLRISAKPAEPHVRARRVSVESPIVLKRRARLLEGSVAAAASIILGAEAAAYALGILQVWEAFVMTPLAPLLATFILFIDYELGHYEALWRGRWVREDFHKSLLMILGGLLMTFGLMQYFTSVSTDLNRVIIDTGSGTSLMCAGIYVVKRFAW